LDPIDASTLLNGMLSDSQVAAITALSANGTISGNFYVYSFSTVYAGISNLNVAFDGMAANITKMADAAFSFDIGNVLNVTLESADSDAKITLHVTGRIVFTSLSIVFPENDQVTALNLDWNGSVIEMNDCGLLQAVSAGIDFRYVLIAAGLFVVGGIGFYILREHIKRYNRKHRKGPQSSKSPSRLGLIR
jgi:hypothetical protein